MSSMSTRPLRRLASGFGGSLRILVLLVGAMIVAVIGLGSRTADRSAAPAPSFVAVVGAAATGTAGPPTASPTPESSTTTEPTADATAAPTGEPTAAPASTPTSAPIPKATTRTTPRPTPRPTHDPTPEGTPRTTTRSGSFGQTLTVQGVTARVARTAARDGALSCVTDDPDRQGWTELVSYELRMSWPDAGDAEEPWVAVGSKPWNVLQFDGPSPFTSGADYVVSTCHKPADSDKVMVEISPPGSPLIYYRWFFD
jgi:outer membrane biosynthesis protein TonB